MKYNIGYRIYEDFDRPERSLIERFAGIPSSNIGDMMNRLQCMRSELKPYNDKPLLGPAFTVKAPCGDNLILHHALDLAKPGDIIVIDGEGCTDRSLFGEIMIDYAAKRGIAGLVVDGAIRDTDAARKADIPVYAIAATPQGPYKHGPGEINVPIACCGQVVFPGDILVGDEDGIVVIRPQWAEELAETAARKHRAETEELAGRNAADSTEEMVRRHREEFDGLLAGAQRFPFAEK